MAILALSTIPALSAQVTTLPAPVSDPNKVVLSIGNDKITAAEYNDIVNSLPQQYQATARGPGKRQFAEQLVQLKLLSALAQKDKVDQDPKVQKELAFNRDNLLASIMFQRMQENVKVGDPEIEQYYNAHKGEYEAVKARHILVREKGAPMQAIPGRPELTDEEALAKAKAIRARLVAGEDFATIAKAESDDTGSAAQGGELGEFRKGMMVPPFEQAAFAAKVGEITEPVKTPFGYHIIKVEAHTAKSLAEAKPDIEKKLRPEMARLAVEAMRKDAAVTIDDSFFGPAPAPRPAVPAAAK